MGFFSWKTSDKERSISCVKPFTVYLLNPFGEPFREDDYEGYGVFGGKDAYQFLAECNWPDECVGDVEHDRGVGIEKCFDLMNEKGAIKYPLKFSENPDADYYKLAAAADCEYQGYFYPCNHPDGHDDCGCGGNFCEE
jgi:hypothetical protein